MSELVTRKKRLNIPGNQRTGVSAVMSYAAMAIVAVCFLLPLAWMLLASFNNRATFATRMPKYLSLANYKDILTPEMSLRPLANSFVIASLNTVIVLICAVMVAYPISRFQSKFNKPFMYAILFGSCLPLTAFMVPVYAMFVAMNLLDSTFGTVLFMAATNLPMAVWLTKSFMDSVPIEIEEAAWVDGASRLQTLWRVVVPLMRPGLIAVGTFVFMGGWGDFFTPFMLLMSPDKLPASVAIYNFFGMHGSVAYGQLAAFAMLYSIPPVILYTISKHLGTGTYSMAGGIKG